MTPIYCDCMTFINGAIVTIVNDNNTIPDHPLILVGATIIRCFIVVMNKNTTELTLGVFCLSNFFSPFQTSCHTQSNCALESDEEA